MTIKFLFLFIFLTCLAAFPANASTRIDFQTADMLTYRCYTEQKWDSVILVGKQALRSDIDYYYLRVRLGIAYFEKKEYFPAATHLKKARQFNSGDAFVADYLYRSYVMTNQTEEASLLRAKAPPEVWDTAKYSQGFLQQLHFETGYTLSSDRNPANLPTLMGKDSIYGEQDLYGNNFYGNFAVNLRASNRLSFSLAYNYLNFNKTKYIQYGHAEAQRDSIGDRPFSRDYFYSFPWKIHDTSFRYHVQQHEVYLGATLSLPWGIRIMPAVHWVHVSSPLISASVKTDSISDTAFYLKSDGTYHLFKYPSVVYSYTQKDTSFNNYLAALRISKDLGRFSIALSGSWSNLNGKTQEQAGLSLSYFPLGNLNLYGTTAVTGFFQGSESRILLSQVLGGRLTPWMWGEANFNYGDYTNANIANGAIVYNNSDKIDYRAGGTLTFVLGKHIQLSLIYQYFRKESQQIYYIKSQDPVSHEIREVQQTQYNKYNSNTLIGGITWKL
ncbi:MAG: hypothetical protein WCK92_15125 [Bacteroidota bacterium]